MIKELWDKTIFIRVQMHSEDIASDCPVLPLLFEASQHHYFGMYTHLITSFFTRHICHPVSPTQFNLHLTDHNSPIHPTDIISNVFNLYVHRDKVINVTVHFRSQEEVPEVDLMSHFKHQIKASTCIRNKKQGAMVLLSEFTIEQFNNLYQSFRNNDYQSFLGSEEEDTQNIGFRRLLKKCDWIPVVVVTKEGRVMRQMAIESKISHIKEELGHPEVELYLLGVKLIGDSKVASLLVYSHTDGFLYLTTGQ